MKGRVEFDRDRCKGCGLCVGVCPKKILGLEETLVNAKGYHPAGIFDPPACIGCANCGRICPDSVITVWRQREDG